MLMGSNKPYITALPQGAAPNGIARVVGVVVVLAAAVEGLAYSATNLWLQPDSWEHIQLAGDLAQGLGFANERFLVRAPGYPMMLACVFRIFGEHSPAIIAALQHLAIVGVNVLVVLIAWHVSRRASVALIAGLLSVGSLHLPAMASTVLTEAPFSLLLMGSVYFLIRYHREGGGRLVALASLFAGLAYLVRPMGITVVAACVVAVLDRVRQAVRERRQRAAANDDAASCNPDNAPSGLIRLVWAVRYLSMRHLALAILPAFVFYVGWQSLLVSVHQTTDAWNCFSGILLYHRTVAVEHLDDPQSTALAHTRRVVAEAKSRGLIHQGVDNQRWYTVWWALRDVEGMTLPAAARVMAEAGRDVMGVHRGLVAKRTMTHVARTLLMPEGSYRYVPGGAPGNGWRQAEDAVLLDASMFEPLLRPRMEPYNHYMPLGTESSATTPVWSAMARWYHRNIERGPSILGIGDSPYEAFVYLCLFGGVLSLATRDRARWMLLVMVIAGQVVPSAFAAGTIPRYGVPTQPLMKVFAALVIYLGVRSAAAASSRLRRRTAGASPDCALRRHSAPTI